MKTDYFHTLRSFHINFWQHICKKYGEYSFRKRKYPCDEHDTKEKIPGCIFNGIRDLVDTSTSRKKK